jgi:hypothetical protein
MQHLYTATFSTGEVREQIYSRELTHAYRVTYSRNGATATKYGFSGSREKAEKAVKLPKACTDVTSEIVHAMKLDAPTKTTSAKPKKVKPFAKGDLVFLRLHGTDIPAIVIGVRGDKATLRVTGILNDVRVGFLDISKPLDPTPLAQAA